MLLFLICQLCNIFLPSIPILLFLVYIFPYIIYSSFALNIVILIYRFPLHYKLFQLIYNTCIFKNQHATFTSHQSWSYWIFLKIDCLVNYITVLILSRITFILFTISFNLYLRLLSSSFYFHQPVTFPLEVSVSFVDFFLLH